MVEFFDMMDAFVEEEQRQDDVENQRFAWQTAHLMNATGNYKKTIKSTDLYRPLDYVEEDKEVPQQNIVKKFDSKEQKEDYLNALLKKFGKTELNTDSSQ